MEKNVLLTRDTSYFTRVQILDRHTGCGGVKVGNQKTSHFDDSIAVYSFALKPEDHQPSDLVIFQD